MIDRLVALALEKRLVVVMICLFLAGYGYYSWTQLPLEAYPDIADVTSQVVTLAPGLAAAIPALVAYNYFMGQIRQMRATMDDFALEFLNLAERNFT